MQAQLSALDDQFQTKLAADAERYDVLLRDKEALNERWDEQNKQLLQQQEQLLEEVTAECEAKVQVSGSTYAHQAVDRLSWICLEPVRMTATSAHMLAFTQCSCVPLYVVLQETSVLPRIAKMIYYHEMP